MLWDGTWVDNATMAVATICGVHRPLRRKVFIGTFKTEPMKCVHDALSGATLLPFVLMMGAVASSSLLNDVLTLRVYLGLGGLLGFIAVLGEMLHEH